MDIKGNKLSDQDKKSDIISADGIVKHLQQKDKFLIELFDSVSSTNDLILERAEKNAPENTVIVAQNQISGRGRLGKSFYSPQNSGIYLSLLLRPKFKTEIYTFITSAAAVAVCRAIEKISDKKPEIKWVNDIFVEGKKVCGILTSAHRGTDINKNGYVILGVGINVYPPNGGFPEEIKDTAGSVFEFPLDDAKNRLVAFFLEDFSNIYNELEEKSFVDEYRRRSAVIGKEIFVISNNEKRRALAVDIDDCCRLIVKYDEQNTDILSSGEISIRGIN